MKYYIGIDQGTTLTTAVVANQNMQILAKASVSHTNSYPKDGWVEQDPIQIYNNCIEACRIALTKIPGAKPEDVIAIGFDHQGETCCAWNRKTGKPIYPAIVWQDRRTACLAESINRENGEEILKITGLTPDSYYSATKIKWIIDNVPEAAELLENGDLLVGTLNTFVLSNPYGVATVFGLTAQETKQIVHIAKALIGNRSAVVIKTPAGEVKERIIPAGDIILHSGVRTYRVPVDRGSIEIMEAVRKAKNIDYVTGTNGTNVGGMLEKVRREMANLTDQDYEKVLIKDIMAVDTIIPKEVQGNLANEFAMEKAVGIAAMVKTEKLHMRSLAKEASDRLGIDVEIGGVEGSMAAIGALTTPGTDKPILVVDIGAGSTDACLLFENNETRPVHLAGAGNMVTMIINAELGLNDFDIAEDIKKYPLAKVEFLYHIRHEDGSVQFFEEAIDSKMFARTVIVKPTGWRVVKTKQSMEKIRAIRREAKEKVLITNVLRALERVSTTGNINEFEHVVLVGGSSMDFELGNMVTDKLTYHGIISGKANVRKTEGPRNAVATGLLLSYLEAK